jgi:hypothetical protein
MPYPWYEVVAGPALQQGDLLRHCLEPVLPRVVVEPIPDPAAAPPAEPENVARFDRVVILSQSCDLANGDIERVMVCPVYPLADFLTQVGGNREKQKSTKDGLKKGRHVAYQLLNPCNLDRHEAPHLVADFGAAFSVPVTYAVELAGAGERVRLLPPYREHLAQMFARFYMRVGLPIDYAPLP